MVNETIDTSEDIPVKIVIVGEEAAGKTSICQSLCNPSEDVGQEYYPTVGMDIYKKRLSAGAKAVQLQVFDVSGLALKSRNLVNLLHGSDAILFVYDITNMGSLQKAEEWIKSVRMLYKSAEVSRISLQKRLPFLALVGHKEDLSNQRTVKLEKHYSITKEYCLGGSFFTSSENDALSVPDLFQSVAESLVGDDTEGRQATTNRELTTRVGGLDFNPTSSSDKGGDDSRCTIA